MSNFNKISSTQPNIVKPEGRKRYGTNSQDCINSASLKAKKFASAVGKLRTAIRQSKATVARHWDGGKFLQNLLRRRKKQIGTASEGTETCREPISPPDSVTAPSIPEEETVQERPDQEMLPPPGPIFAVPNDREGSISLSSAPNDSTTRLPYSGRQPHSQLNLILVEAQLRSAGTAAARSSQATTLRNSTAAAEDSSRRPSDTQSSFSFSSPDTVQPSAAAAVIPPPLPMPPFRPRVQTNLHHLLVPGTDDVDEDGHSTIRERHGSSPASAVDFIGLGGLFDDPQNH